jgi:hypothetical protein
MATDNKILWFGAGALTIILLARYYNKKKTLKTSDLKNQGAPIVVAIEPDPTLNTRPVGSPSHFTSGPITVNDLGQAVKKPIYISPQNLIPNVWDRGVGESIYMNATGGEYYNIQKACRCSSKKQNPKTILSQFPL